MNTARGVGRVTALAFMAWHAEAPGQVVAAAAVVVVAVVVVAVVVAVVGMVGRVGQRAAAVVGRRRDEEIAPGPHHRAAQKSRGVFRRRVALYQYRLPRAVAQASFCTKKQTYAERISKACSALSVPTCGSCHSGFVLHKKKTNAERISKTGSALSILPSESCRSGFVLHKTNKLCKAYFEGG